MKKKSYRFYFDKGVPVFDWPTGKTIMRYSWRHGARTIAAYSLTEAVQKLVAPVIQKHGSLAKLNLRKAYSGVEGADWKELDLSAPTIAAFVVGSQEREALSVK
jgi:hypothetical protein